MIIRQKVIHFPTYSVNILENSPELCLFFDIETTGLSWKRSHLYLLGAIFYENSQWIKKLWFCQKPSEESEVLKEFSQLLHSRKYLIHFNGTTFDVPYLMHKYSYYQQEQTWEHLSSIDLYHIALPFKKIWNMEQLKQKDLEKRIGIFRDDPYSGGDLIKFYQDYLKSDDKNLLECLFLHNSEDMDGLVSLLPILYLKELLLGKSETFHTDISVHIHQSDTGTILKINLSLTHKLPLSFDIATTLYHLNFSSENCLITVPILQDTKKYFFEDYKNYYYLKYEDYAIHKSVGAYVDKAYRENAKPTNCYQKKESCFLPIFDSIFSPMYRDNPKDKSGWFELTEEFLHDSDKLHSYAAHLLASVLAVAKQETKTEKHQMTPRCN